MEQIRTRVAGLDVHRDSVMACARIPDEAGHPSAYRRKFKTTTTGLGELAVWLGGDGVTTAAMEATGVYWKPLYFALEGLVEELWLCNAHHVKNVRGRKTDMADAEGRRGRARHGPTQPGAAPSIRALRNPTRYRKAIMDMRTKEKQRLEKVLQYAGIKLSSVASKIMTASGRAMIEALIAGERDTKVPADMSMRKLRNKKAELEETLAGRFDEHHALLASQILGTSTTWTARSNKSPPPSPTGSRPAGRPPSCA
jgi:transposase